MNNNELYIPDMIFPSDNVLEIPSLRLDVQPRSIERPFVCFGEQRRTFKMDNSGTLHFYTDDYRFRSVYDHPEKILQHSPNSIVEPNFSLFADTPIAFGLQAVYKKRAIARMMQEHGIGVFVDLNVNSKFYKLNLIGIPTGYQFFCTRGYEDRPQYLEYEYNIAKMIAGDKPVHFVVYGGGEKIKQLCRVMNLVYITPIIAIKNKIKAFSKISDTIAFGKSVTELIALESDKLFMNQVENFSNKRIGENNYE